MGSWLCAHDWVMAVLLTILHVVIKVPPTRISVVPGPFVKWLAPHEARGRLTCQTLLLEQFNRPLESLWRF